MENQFLMIQNPGEAPVEGFTILGVSLTRDSGGATIGQFGSGGKHSINALLRANVYPTVFCGLTRLAFGTRSQEVSDGLGQRSFNRVHYTISGKDCKGNSISTKTQELSFVAEYGSYDWTTDMALRELVANAIDMSERQDGDFAEAIKQGRLLITVVQENKVRAKKGFTRVFVPLTSDVQKYFGELPQRFLHFSEPEVVRAGTKILPKRGRGLNGSDKPMIYKKGVFVRQVETNVPSVFDYNFGNELTLDESRNVDDYRVRNAAGVAIRDSSPEIISICMNATFTAKELWENTFDSYSLNCSWDSSKTIEDRRQRWQKAIELVAGDKAVVCDADNPYAIDKVRRKGYTPVIINKSPGWAEAAGAIGVLTAKKVLSEDEMKGRELLPPTPAALEAVEKVWKLFASLGYCKKDLPKIVCYKTTMDGGEVEHGFCKDGTIGFNYDSANGGVSDFLLEIAVEELVHYQTGSADGSRDMQDYLIKMFVKVAWNNINAAQQDGI